MGEAHHRDLEIHALPLAHAERAAAERGQGAQHGLRHVEPDGGTGFREARNEAQELEHVAEPLLGEDQHAASGERLALPERQADRGRLAARHAEPVLVLGEPLAKHALAEQEQPAVEMRLGPVGLEHERPVVERERLPMLSHVMQRGGEVGDPARILGEGDGAPPDRDRLGEFPERKQAAQQAARRLRILRLREQEGAPMRGGLRVGLPPVQEQGESAPGRGEPRVEREGAAKFRLRLLVPSGGGERVAEIGVESGHAGPQRDRAPQGVDRRLAVARRHERAAEVVEQVGVAGPQRDRTAQQGGGFVELAARPQGEAHQLQRLDIARLERERGAPEPLGGPVLAARLPGGGIGEELHGPAHGRALRGGSAASISRQREVS